MKKHILLISGVVLLLIIAVLFQLAPWDNWSSNESEDGATQVMPIDFTLDAIKLDADGNEIGTAKIHIYGDRLPSFLTEERIVLTIDPFDDLYQIEDAKLNDKIGHVQHIGKDPDNPGFLRLLYNAKRTGTTDTITCVLTFSPDMQCFAFHCYPFGSDYKETVYVGSVSGDYSTRELIEFFNGLVPGL